VDFPFRRRAAAVLVVLPFEGDERDPVCAGWHEALIDGFEKVEALSVLGPASASAYRAHTEPHGDPHAALGVTARLTGRVTQVDGVLHCSARLVSTDPESQLWSRTWDVTSDDIFGVHFDTVRDVTTALGGRLPSRGEGMLHREPTIDLLAWRSFMKGRLALNKLDQPSLRIAAAGFDDALERDDLFAEAWAGLAACHRLADELHLSLDSPDSLGVPGSLGVPDSRRAAREAATRALEIDDSLPSALVTLAVDAMHEWRFREAGEVLERAVAAGPNHAEAHRWSTRLATLHGDLPAAMASAHRAASLEPLSDTIVNEGGLPYALAGDLAEARARSSDVVHRDPEHSLAYFHLGRYAEQLGRTGEAVTYHRAAAELSGSAPYLTAFLGLALVRIGDRPEAQDIAHDLERKAERGSAIATCLGALLIRLGHEDEGLGWLESAFEGKEGLLLLADTPWLPLPEVRESERFRSLLARLPTRGTP
jgi:TolB-like protein/Tfp pilus assembly protein PilF